MRLVFRRLINFSGLNAVMPVYKVGVGCGAPRAGKNPLTFKLSLPALLLIQGEGVDFSYICKEIVYSCD